MTTETWAIDASHSGIHFSVRHLVIAKVRGQFKPFSDATDLVPGLRAQPAPGHTPGHTFYVAESKGERDEFTVVGRAVAVADEFQNTL